MNPEIIINYSNSCHSVSLAEIPAEWVEDFESRLNEAEAAKWHGMVLGDVDKVWMLLKEQNLKNARAEAARMGMLPHPTEMLLHDPWVLVGLAQGREAGIELAKKWGLYEQAADTWGRYFEPCSMWDEVAHRRDGDAVVLFVGDDRGYAPNWTYYVCVKWEPQAVKGWMESRGLRYHEE